MTNLEELMVLSPRVQAERLAAALTRKGFIAMQLTTADHDRHPCVQLTWSPAIGKTAHAYIYVAEDEDGVWWFFWDTMEAIIPAAYVHAAAEQITAEINLRKLRLFPVRAV